METLIFTTIRFEGFHNWPEAPEEVNFLRNRHRHIFIIKAYKKVNHDDRDIEFIMLGREIFSFLDRSFPTAYGGGLELSRMSCESLATVLLNEFSLEMCEVSEDGENGAIKSAKNILLPD